MANGGELEDVRDIASKAVSATVTPGRDLDREISPMESDVAAISAGRSREQVRADSLLMASKRSSACVRLRPLYLR